MSILKLKLVSFRVNEKGKDKLDTHSKRVRLAEKEYNKAIEMDIDPDDYLIEEMDSDPNLKDGDYDKSYQDLRIKKSEVEAYNSTIDGETFVYMKSGMDATVRESVAELDYMLKPWWYRFWFKLVKNNNK